MITGREPNILRCLPARSASPAKLESVFQTEKDHQKRFIGACKERGWRPVWHAMHKRSSANAGTPDAIVAARGTTFWIEFKLPGEQLSPAQSVFGRQLAANGVRMHTVYSAEEGVALIENFQSPTL